MNGSRLTALSQRDRCLKQINRPHIGKRMSKASYNSRKKRKDEMVAARQFEVNECKAITTEKERIMDSRQTLKW